MEKLQGNRAVGRVASKNDLKRVGWSTASVRICLDSSGSQGPSVLGGTVRFSLLIPVKLTNLGTFPGLPSFGIPYVRVMLGCIFSWDPSSGVSPSLGEGLGLEAS